MKIHTVSEFDIYCDICNESDFIQTCDSEYLGPPSKFFFFFKQGWRSYGGLTLCPECAKKYIEYRKKLKDGKGT